MHQLHIHHGHFIYNNQISFYGVLFIPQEPLTAVTIFQQAVNGACGHAGRLRHAFCCTARRCAQLTGKPHILHDADDKTQNCGLSCARAAGNDKRAACERTNDRLTLLWRKGNRKLTFQKRYLLLRIQEQERRWRIHHLQEASCAVALKEMHPRKEYAVHAPHRLVNDLVSNDKLIQGPFCGQEFHAQQAFAGCNSEKDVPW